MNKIDYLRMIAKCLEDILTAIYRILKKKEKEYEIFSTSIDTYNGNGN
ncbi:hypothetical protein MOP91_04485 [Enterococcus faecium]|nr:hypothetical protein [Enterococcus faecium]